MTALLAAVSLAAAAGPPALLAPPAPPRPAAVGELNDIRVWSAGEITRVAIETSAEARFEHGRVPTPDRIFVDLEETRPDASRHHFTIPVDDGLIKQIRVGLNQSATTRVVLDLAVRCDYTVSHLANPNRVMLELRRYGSARPVPAPAESKVDPAPPPRPMAARAEPRRFVLPSATVRAKAFVLEQPPALRLAARVRRFSDPKFPIAKAVAPPPAPTRTLEPPPPVQAAVVSDPPLSPRPAQNNRNGKRSLTRVLGLKLNRVVLDPGHGGYDQGTAGRSGLIEKELVLDVAERLGRLIEEGLGAEVVYTRTGDVFVPLEERTRIANQREADLFLSIHANSSPYRSVGGVETYYLSFTTSKEDMEVAARENASSQRSMHELSDLVRQIALQDKAEESRDFAARVQAASHALASQGSPRARNRGVKKAPFVVLIGARMPSVLTEIGFVSNAREEALLKRPEHREKIAEALYKGIYQYAETLSHFSVASAADGGK